MNDATLAQLILQRNALNEQIRMMSNKFAIHGRAKIDKVHYTTAKPDEYGIYVRRNTGDTDAKESWYRIIISTDKAKAIAAIPEIVEDLKALFNMICEETRSDNR